jgi:FolB domain-containing protein
MRPSGWLSIEGVHVRCIIGVGERERQTPQEIIVSYHVKVDFEKAASADSIQDTADYRAVTRRLTEACERSSFRLVESLATHLCRTILTDFPIVEEVRIEVEKPGALSAARSVRAIATLARGS